MSPRAKIEAYLEARDLSQTHFAEMCGVAQSRLNDVIRNDKPVTLRLAIPIAKKLDMSLDDFMNESVAWPGPDRTVPPRVLSPDEEQILDLAKQLRVGGLDWVEVARRRLLGLPLDTDPVQDGRRAGFTTTGGMPFKGEERERRRG